MSDPSFASATALAADLRARRIGCVELLEHLLARADRLNAPLNAIVAFDREGARARARRGRRGTRPGRGRGDPSTAFR